MMYIYNVRNGPYLAFVAPMGPYLSDDGLEDKSKYPPTMAPRSFPWPYPALSLANPVALLSI